MEKIVFQECRICGNRADGRAANRACRVCGMEAARNKEFCCRECRRRWCGWKKRQ